MVTHKILQSKKEKEKFWTYEKSYFILLKLCRGFSFCKGPGHQYCPSQILFATCHWSMVSPIQNP